MSMNNDLDPQAMARAFGLDLLADNYPEDIKRAATFAKSLAEGLPRDMIPAEEPAHVFRSAQPDTAS